jgi:glycerol-3-phosphate dehydrogenase (NAD(P)+)
MKNIAILGGGAWGSALASALTMAGHDIRIWVRREDLARELMKGRSPAIDLDINPPQLASTDLNAVVDGASYILNVLPVSTTLESIAMLQPHLAPDIPVIWAAKGLIGGIDALIPEVAKEHWTNRSVMLSGPSFADEVAAGKPAAIVAAAEDNRLAIEIAGLFSGSMIRVYSSPDPIGVAVGGAVKNVIAIASGMISGLDLGDNARAALLTRGLAETMRFSQALGGRAETLFGLAGVGDMTLSCAGPHSRNFALGLALGRGEQPSGRLAEGKYSAAVIARRAENLDVEMPITQAVARVLESEASIASEIERLLSRPAESEWR